MHFIIASVHGADIYWMHTKLYTNEKTARRVLKNNIEKGVWSEGCEVFGIRNFNLIPLKEVN